MQLKCKKINTRYNLLDKVLFQNAKISYTWKKVDTIYAHCEFFVLLTHFAIAGLIDIGPEMVKIWVLDFEKNGPNHSRLCVHCISYIHLKSLWLLLQESWSVEMSGFYIQWGKVVQYATHIKWGKPKTQIPSKLWQKIGYGKPSLQINQCLHCCPFNESAK